MFGKREPAPPVTVTHDILLEKQGEVERLARQANEAVDLVTRTISNLESINKQLDSDMAEIDAYAKELTATRANLFKQRNNNAIIISNFSKLLGVEAEAEAEADAANGEE